MKFNKTALAAALCASISATSTPPTIAQNTANPQPNVIFIMTDDNGPGEYKAYDNLDGLGRTSKIATPDINAIATNGIRFNNAHASTTLCAPSRATLMAGAPVWKTSVRWSFGRSSLDKGQQSVGDLMKSAGYSTAFIGKGHMGGRVLEVGSDDPVRERFSNVDRMDFDRPMIDGPNDHGFDYTLYLLGGIQQNPYLFWEDGLAADIDADGNTLRISNSNKSTLIRKWSKGYIDEATEILATGLGSVNWKTRDVPQAMLNKSIDFLHDSLATNPDKPFFLQYHSVTGHSPYVPAKTVNVDINRDGDTDDAGESYTIDGYDGTGPVPDDSGTTTMRMVSMSNAEVGVLMSYLKQTDDPRNPSKKLVDNTVVIFTSDNGGIGHDYVSNYNVDEGSEWDIYEHDSTAGLHGNKSTSEEGGHRVPFLVQWPSRIPAGTVREQQISTVDLMATLAGITGQSLIDQGQGSYNMLPVFLGDRDDQDPVHDSLIVEDTGGKQKGNTGIRRSKLYFEGDWKLILSPGLNNPRVLAAFNLANDPAEQNNLADRGAPIINSLLQNYIEKRNAERLSPVFIGYKDEVSVADLSGYTHVTIEGGLRNSGTIQGNLDVNQGGRIIASNRPGRVLTVNGDYIQRTGGTLQLKLGGNNHDQLRVNGQLKLLGGTLVVELNELYSPSAGDQFTLFSAEATTGSFEHIELPSLTNGLGWNTDSLMATGSLSVVNR